ncbi:shikimate kinase [Thermocrinis sp.]|uniref:shikimate kinase n=1 Tax=Thermocrinis sp. TaxID=2024383 RepID=UPI002FDD25E6
MIPRRIFLIGFMCSGKSTVGRILAKRLSYSFVDLDEFIEQREGKSIQEIFSNYGEEYFRRMELEVLDLFLNEDRVVVSTGGGLGANGDALNRMKLVGFVVWLDIDFETFLKRCSNSEGRPLLKKGLDYVKELMERRKEVYSLAHLRVDGRKSPEDLTDYILQELMLAYK